MSVLSARGLRKSYGELEVVSGLDLEVAPGECFGLLGPNGAGKTTTLKLCLGLVDPDAGDIELLGEPVPLGTLVIHGEVDQTIPLKAVLDWARPQELPVLVLPGADHFFHRKLPALKLAVTGNWK